MNIHRVYDIVNRRFRVSRIAEFENLFSIKDADRIIDIGGTVQFWKYSRRSPQIVIVNLLPDGKGRSEGRFEIRHGDGTNLADFDNESFDISFSNSVIEHVGDTTKVESFAREVRRVGRSYYVQTPNKYFFIEPHFLIPFFHWLPKRLFRKYGYYFALWTWITGASREEWNKWVDSINLLNEAEFSSLFPDAQVFKERFLFMTKSLIAVHIDTQLGRSEELGDQVLAERGNSA